MNASGTKESALREALRGLGSVVVALSGGVDSATLAVLAHRVLGARSLAVTGVSPSLSAHQRELVRRTLEVEPMPHRWIPTAEMEDVRYRRNERDRCFFCKNELYGTLRAFADRNGFRAVADGTNRDDEGDERPGRRAAARFGVRAPLLEAGFGKADVRDLAQRLGIPVWEEPASACLASRIPHRIPIDANLLEQVEAGEAALRDMGFGDSRVRHHGDLARIELPPDAMERLLQPEVSGRIARRLQALGFRRVAVDRRGYQPAGTQAPFRPERDLIELQPVAGTR